MPSRRKEVTRPLAPALVGLADRLFALDQELQKSQRELRRLSGRVAAANGYRRGLVSLAAALLRQRHRSSLEAIGAEPYDIAEAEVDTPYDGLLISLGRGARTAGIEIANILVVDRARHLGEPAFAAELLRARLVFVSAEAAASEATAASDVAVVADLRQLLANPELCECLQRHSVLLIALLDPSDPAGVEILQDEARQLIEILEASGFETVHISGAGDQIAFAQRGLVVQGRRDLLSGEPA